MSTVADFNRIDDCDKIDSQCIDGFHEFTYDGDDAPTTLCDKSSWGGDCIDLEPLVKAAESCTSLYLSPEDSPNCLVYEKEERCGDNDCIHGDDLSRIISMTKLKDVDQSAAPTDGAIYIYNGETKLFEPFDLKTALANLSIDIQNLGATVSNWGNRITAIETKLTPPEGAPDDVKVSFSNINLYSDPNVVIAEGSGTVTTLDKTHGIYSHALATNAYGDEITG